MDSDWPGGNNGHVYHLERAKEIATPVCTPRPQIFLGREGEKTGDKRCKKGDNLAIFHVIRSWNEPNLHLLTGVNDGLGSGGKKNDRINGIK